MDAKSGVVKAVPSGDTLVVVGPPPAGGGPPPEKTIKLSSIAAPQLGWKDRADEEFAWQAREALREKVIGQRVTFTLDKKQPPAGTGAPRDYGDVHLGQESLASWLVSEGWARVRQKNPDERSRALEELERAAIEAGKGVYTRDEQQRALAVRDNKFSGTFEVRDLFEAIKGRPVDAIIEQVRDGSTMRVVLLPTFHNITLFLAGIRSPGWKRAAKNAPPNTPDTPEPYAAEAKYFTEIRLLHRFVQVVLEGLDDRSFLYGTIIFPMGNISEALVREGLAKVQELGAAQLDYADRLRGAEAHARNNRLRMWKSYEPRAKSVKQSEREFEGIVTEIHSGDSVTVLDPATNTERRLFLASMRAPRIMREDKSEPYAYEAKEFLRKRLIGRRVNVTMDYIREAKENLDRRAYATILIGGKNIAEGLLVNGLAEVVRHREDEERSSQYDLLASAQAKGQKQNNGKFNTAKEAPIYRQTDISKDAEKARTVLSTLQGRGRLAGVVDFVVNGARLKVLITRESLVIPVVLEGIRCPKYDGKANGSEPFGEAAYLMTRNLCFQRDVEIEVESVDKGGSFVGSVFIDGVNLSIRLLEEGLAYVVQKSAERSAHGSQLIAANNAAKAAKRNYWSVYVEPAAPAAEEETTASGGVEAYDVMVTEIVDPVHFWVQVVGDGTVALEQMMSEFAAYHSTERAGLAAKPRVGDLVAAKFTVDDQWYRAKIKAVEGNQVTVFFVDYGNGETIPVSRIRALGDFAALAPQARECLLALCLKPSDSDSDLIAEGMDIFRDFISAGRPLIAKVEFKNDDNVWCVSLYDAQDNNSQLSAALLKAGAVRVQERRSRFLNDLASSLKKFEQEAKDSKQGLWYYGDVDYDEPKEGEVKGKGAGAGARR